MFFVINWYTIIVIAEENCCSQYFLLKVKIKYYEKLELLLRVPFFYGD